MKHLALTVALLAVADMVFRHGSGMHAVLHAGASLGHAVGAWVYYGA